ncbi:MAG: galactose-1-phosphate uridylyltransferase [Candidatus Micrarchaeia archaeon]
MPQEENELRWDPLLKRGVIIAKNRAKRPTDFIQKKAVAEEGVCFFCPGNEHLTPPEIARVEASPPYRFLPAPPDVASGRTPATKGGWLLRVFPNKFNATSLDFPAAYGTHEIIVETPDHASTMSELPAEHIARVIDVYCERTNALRENKKIRYVSIFKNEGREAGASLRHTHTQLISQDVVPPAVDEEISANKAFAEKHGSCYFCAARRLEADRIVFEDEHFFAFCPFASRFHFETWFVAKRHAGQLTDLTDEERFSLARALKTILSRLDAMLNRPPYNFHLHTAPLAGGPSYHFHLELTPRLAVWAGYEFCTGLYINSLPPEEAARALRE